MADEENEVQFAPPTTQVDLERRLANGNQSDRVLSTADNYVPDTSLEGRELVVEGNETDAYVNVDPIYQNYANETEAPARAESDADNPEADLEAIVHGEAVQTPEGVKEASEDDPAAIDQTGPPPADNEVMKETAKKRAAKAEAQAEAAKKAVASDESSDESDNS